ncbi:E3 ubiquitin-protein ligase TRIM39-like [Sarcophilus harrisii]|uniref:E3 ubiquitin-protein ligase TRIM39-like n=1 Tax=Sarcophilus harrisii TaxID=9305 RepID=UPI00062B9D00|nr:E3 ubiquitin-protein ligase TRIM39-like [Sarcophilus harrisii]
MDSYLISNLWEELKCPICLDFFTCATSIECGHNFCAGCIHALMIKTSKSRFRCPKCHKKCMKNTRPNRQLGTIAQSFKLLTLHMTRNWKLRDVIRRKFFEEIFLDPETACPGIIVSRDMKTIRRKVKFKKMLWKGSNLCHAILATQSFMSGRHYWEVTVGNSSAWDVGLCKKSLKKGKFSPSPSTGHWLLSLRQETYIVCTMPRMSIPIPRKLYKVGIFLDYEAGYIMFYDVDTRCLIYTFTSSFSEPLFPIFSIGLSFKNKNILTIDPVPDEAAETPEHAQP